MTDNIEMLLTTAKYGIAIGGVQFLGALITGGLSSGEARRVMGICAAWSLLCTLTALVSYIVVLVIDAMGAM